MWVKSIQRNIIIGVSVTVDQLRLLWGLNSITPRHVGVVGQISHLYAVYLIYILYGTICMGCAIYQQIGIM